MMGQMMSTQIIYKNQSKEIITQQQALELDDYEIYTIANAYLKSIKKVHFRKYTIERINGVRKLDYSKPYTFIYFHYFLENNETKTDILIEAFKDKEVSAVTLLFNRQLINGLAVYDWEKYNTKDEIIYKGKKIYNAEFKLIMECQYNLDTNELKYPVHKYFKQFYNGYERNYEFWFSKNDSQLGYYLNLIDLDEHNDDFRINDLLAEMPNFFIDFPYYQTLLPLIPLAPIV